MKRPDGKYGNAVTMEHGGLRERMTRARLSHRNQHPRR